MTTQSPPSQFPSKVTQVLSPDGTFSPFWFNWFLLEQKATSGLVSGGIGQPQAQGTFLAGPVGPGTALPQFRAINTADLPGLNATITTAKLTSGGNQGSMTFVNGLLIAQNQAT